MRFKNMFFACLLCVSVLFTAGSSANSLVSEETVKRHTFYQRALYEACEEMSGLQVTLKKLTVTNSKAMETEYFCKITGYASSVQNSLSVLPVNVNEIKETMKFVNQTGDFALAALKKISRGAPLNASDRETLLTLTETSTKLCIALGEVTEGFADGKNVFTEDGNAPDGFRNLTHPKEEYPTLLYDGPFSDSITQKPMIGLDRNTVTMEEAKRVLSDFIETDENKIRFLHETGGAEQTYEFEIPEKHAQAAVTKRGGKVLYILSEKAYIDKKLSEEECIDRAKAFLSKKGFPQMHAGYYRKYEGVITVNLAPVEHGVILYPDLIKIEVDMGSGDVIGAEFTNYYMNHTKRDLGEIRITGEEKERYENMSVLSVRPALIPLDTTEKLTFEIHVKDENNEYLIYTDAETGEEVMLYEVVQTPMGTIVQ